MREFRIVVTVDGGHSTIRAALSPLDNVEPGAPGTSILDMEINGHVFSERIEPDQASFTEIVRAVCSDLLRELACNHTENPWCELGVKSTLSYTYPDVVVPE